MMRLLAGCSAVMSWSVGLAAGAPASVPPPISVPEGFVVEPVAVPPMVEHPMMGAFDDRGRLFVAESDGINREHPELLKLEPHSMLMLEDTDGDGRFDRRTVFADKMVLPNGALWHDGALYVTSAPYLWRLEDTDGDGVADKRDKILGKFNFTGMSDSMHGPALHPDGRLYWCGGQHGYEVLDADGRVQFKGIAPGVFSCRTDGSDAEILGNGGHANPVEVTFTPEGEVLGTLSILDNRSGRHDAVLHWVRGAVYSVKPDRLATLKPTGDFMPPMNRFGQMAPSGITRYRSTYLDPSFRGSVFYCRFNTHNVVRMTVERNGSTFVARDHDFLASESIDFHATDVIEDADGSLLVIDTGGWFRYGCPTSVIEKPNILGAIYRVRKKGGAAPADPRGLKIDWTNASNDALIRLLDDERFVVRDRAVAVLAKRAGAAVDTLTEALKSGSERTRRNAVWALTRIASPAAMAALRSALADEARSVRQAAVHSAGTNRDREAVKPLIRLAVSDEPPVQRAAAEALGRIGDAACAPVLFDVVRTQTDRFLEHALMYALISINDPDATKAGLADASPLVRRAALIALDRMDAGQLTRDEVTALLDTTDTALQRAAVDVITSRKEWAGQIIGLLGQWLDADGLTDQRAAMIRGALLAFKTDERIQSLIADRLAGNGTPTTVQLLLLETVARSALSEPPAVWLGPLAVCLESGESRVLFQAIRTISAIGPNGVERFDSALLGLADDANRPARIRVAALHAVAGRAGGRLVPSSFDLLMNELADDAPALDRLEAAKVLGKASLTRGQLRELTEVVEVAGPLELPSLVAAFDHSTDGEIGDALVAALSESEGLWSLRLSYLEELIGRYPISVQEAARPLLKELRGSAEDQKARLAELEPALADGDPVQGKQLFSATKTACAVCHRIGGEGGLVGPNLTEIGQIRSPRDLLEAIVFPSATFARGYEPVALMTTDGAIYSGVIHRETADAIHLYTSRRTEIRIERSQIDLMAPDKFSIMPQGLDRTLTPQELADLVAYVGSLK